MTWNEAVKCAACGLGVDGAMMHVLEDTGYVCYHVRCLTPEQLSKLATVAEMGAELESALKEPH